MSNLGPVAGGNRRAPGVPTPPRGEPIARYATYLEAQRAVDYLSDSHFPVQFVTIVGTDLRMVERVTGRLSYGRVALAGLLSGAWFGLFVGLLLSIFSSGDNYLLGTAILVGAGFGMLFGVVSYAATGGRRDFTSSSQIVASEYQVLCLAEHAQRARELLIQLERTPGMAGLRTQPPGNPYLPGPPTGGQPTYPNPYTPPPASPPPPGAVNPYGAPGAVAPPPPPEPQPQEVPAGLTYGEVMEQRRREQREKDQTERRERAERVRAAAADRQPPTTEEPAGAWQEPGSAQPASEAPTESQPGPPPAEPRRDGEQG